MRVPIHRSQRVSASLVRLAVEDGPGRERQAGQVGEVGEVAPHLGDITSGAGPHPHPSPVRHMTRPVAVDPHLEHPAPSGRQCRNRLGRGRRRRASPALQPATAAGVLLAVRFGKQTRSGSLRWRKVSHLTARVLPTDQELGWVAVAGRWRSPPVSRRRHFLREWTAWGPRSESAKLEVGWRGS